MDRIPKYLANCFLLALILVSLKSALASEYRGNWPEMVRSVEVLETDQNILIESVLVNTGSVFTTYQGESLKKNTEYWVRVVIDNTKARQQNYFIQFLNYASEIRLYQRNDSSLYSEVVGGYMVPEKKRTNGKIGPNRLPFSISSQNETILYIYYYTKLEQSFRLTELNIVSPESFQKKQNNKFIVEVFFSGIILILLILNITLLVLIKDRLYLYYSLYILFNWLYFLRYAQISEQYILSNLPTFNLSLYFSIIFAQAAYIWFIYELLKREKAGKWNHFLHNYRYLVSVLAIVILAFSFVNLRKAIGLNNIYSIINAILAIVMFVVLFSRVSKILKIVLSGTVLLASTGFISHIARLLGIYSLVISTYHVGFFIEMVLFTIAINHFYYNERLENNRMLIIKSQIDELNKDQEIKNRMLERRLEENTRDIATKAFLIAQKDQLIKNVAEKLKEIKNFDINLTLEIQRILNTLNIEQKNDSWEEFEMCLKRIHPRFYSELACLYPGLSKSDIKLCALIKLNLSTKQIASVTGKTINSIDVARSRLCKKMGVRSTDLIAIINTIASSQAYSQNQDSLTV